MPLSHAARLIAASRQAQEQTAEAIRSSLRLLRQSAYPGERPRRAMRPDREPTPPDGDRPTA